jgi:hypothetical protein
MTLRFEIDAIRSWTRARRDKAVPPSPHHTNGSATGELAAILEAYDRRFESVAAAERTDAERHEEFRLEAARLMDSVISPTLHRVGEEITQHGHGWKVESRVDILGQPALACAFSTRETRASTHGPSELSFRFMFPDRLTVAGSAHDGSELQELPPRSYEITNLDGDLVRKEVVRFVAGVLAHE